MTWLRSCLSASESIKTSARSRWCSWNWRIASARTSDGDVRNLSSSAKAPNGMRARMRAACSSCGRGP